MSTTTVANPDAATNTTNATSGFTATGTGITQPAPVDATGTNGGPQGSDAKTFTQAELDAIVKDRLERANRKRDDEAAKIKADEADKALQAQQQFKELADKRADRIVELEATAATIEPLQQERDRLANVVADLVKQQRDGLPEHVIELLEGKDVVEQLAWITKHGATLTGRTGGPTTGVAGLPRPAGNIPREQLIAQEIEAQRARPRR